jgi:hypothetical protein
MSPCRPIQSERSRQQRRPGRTSGQEAFTEWETQQPPPREGDHQHRCERQQQRREFHRRHDPTATPHRQGAVGHDRVQSLGDELATATPEAIQSIVALLVERVETRDRQVVGWVPTGPAEPFFNSALLSPWRPRTVLGERASHADPLAWYAALAA